MLWANAAEVSLKRLISVRHHCWLQNLHDTSHPESPTRHIKTEKLLRQWPKMDAWAPCPCIATDRDKITCCSHGCHFPWPQKTHQSGHPYDTPWLQADFLHICHPGHNPSTIGICSPIGTLCIGSANLGWKNSTPKRWRHARGHLPEKQNAR